MALKIQHLIKSYLSERKQNVVIRDKESSTKDVKYGVPQGSVLGPILFQIYMAPIGDLITDLGLEHHIYADDISYILPSIH